MTPILDEKFINIARVGTRYYEAGQGHAVVMIHGGEPGGSAAADIWATAGLLSLSERFWVLAPDRLGQGYTGNPNRADDYRITKICDHIVTFLKAKDVASATLVGQSRGAYIVACIAMTHPDLVQRLVLINSASMAPRLGADISVYRKLVVGSVDSVRSDAEALSVTTQHITDAWVRDVQRMRAQPKIAEAMSTFERVASDYYADFDVRKHKVLDWLATGGYGGPTLMVWGVGDPLTTLDDGLDLFNVLRNGAGALRLHIVDKCGHYPFREYPKEFNDVVASFIETT